MYRLLFVLLSSFFWARLGHILGHLGFILSHLGFPKLTFGASWLHSHPARSIFFASAPSEIHLEKIAIHTKRNPSFFVMRSCFVMRSQAVSLKITKRSSCFVMRSYAASPKNDGFRSLLQVRNSKLQCDSGVGK